MIIYKFTNKITGQSYIGKTIQTLNERFSSHCSKARNGSEFKFHIALREYGVENFESEILEDCTDILDLVKLEKYYIKKFDTYRNGYNGNQGGSGYGQGLLAKKSKEKFRKTMNEIQSNGLTKKENTDIKRIKTLLDKDKNHFKIIGKKSSKTQKKNGKNKGNNNPNYNKEKILFILKNGQILDTFLRSEIKKLPDNYPKRMIEETIRTNIPMYFFNKPRNKKYNDFIGAIACYESKIYCKININKRNIGLKQ